jgi:hypothetical protein
MIIGEDGALFLDGADDIFKAMNMLRDAQVKKHDHLDGVFKAVLKSPSFRIGHFVTRLVKFGK